LTIVISACLLGHETRYDGKSKPMELPPCCAGARIIPFCPEVAAGLGVPREKIELRESGSHAPPRAIRISDGADLTRELAEACENFFAQNTAADMFILKSRSPSCGLAAPLRDPAGADTGNTAHGIWAAMIRERFPATPAHDEFAQF